MAKTALGHAVVIGGSMAGLLAARGLSDRFERVTLIERDIMSDEASARKGQPQARHLHALTATGFDHLRAAFPGISESLVEGGAVVQDVAKGMRWYSFGGYRAATAAGFNGVFMSRPYLEGVVRERTRRLPNITMIDGCNVDGVTMNASRTLVQGLEVTHRSEERTETILSDFVVDATGRGSALSRWLEHWGYEKPVDDHVKVGVSYATRIYEREPDDATAAEWIVINPTPPHEKRGGGMLPIEGNRRIVTLMSVAGERPPMDDASFLEFAESLPAKDIYELIRRSVPASDIVLHKFPSSQRRHFQRLSRFPEGIVPLGDSLASFNPIYAQGMTSAALQVDVLNSLLRDGSGIDGIAEPYFRKTTVVVDRLWQLAVGEDFRYPETEGEKQLGTDLLNAYVLRFHKATHHDPVACRAFLKVVHMIAPPSSLLRPDLVFRALWPFRS